MVIPNSAGPAGLLGFDITGPGSIYTSGSCVEFFGGPPAHILHEYYHVQYHWSSGTLGFILSYAAQAVLHGNHNDIQYEEEATQFGKGNAKK